jgi:hypothetical protein
MMGSHYWTFSESMLKSHKRIQPLSRRNADFLFRKIDTFALSLLLCKNLTAPVLTIKGQLFAHTSPIFSSDALHGTQKSPRMTKNCLLFWLETAG